jgi:hypothetical protein
MIDWDDDGQWRSKEAAIAKQIDAAKFVAVGEVLIRRVAKRRGAKMIVVLVNSKKGTVTQGRIFLFQKDKID